MNIKESQNLKKFINFVTRIRNNDEGVAAIEFAMVIPFLIFFMVGAVSLFDGYQGAEAYQKAGTTVVDLVTRQETDFGDTERDMIFATADALLDKYGDSGDFEISITSVANIFDSDSDPSLSIEWSEANVPSAVLEEVELANYKIPSIPEGGTVILIVMSGTYKSILSVDSFGEYNYSRYFIRRPRFLDSIPYAD